MIGIFLVQECSLLLVYLKHNEEREGDVTTVLLSGYFLFLIGCSFQIFHSEKRN